MVHITKVYTKTGDQGKTGLAGNLRLSKNSPRIAVIGDVDELNAALGFVVAELMQNCQFTHLLNKILRIQNELFNLGAELAVLPPKRRPNTPMLQTENITQLEHEIDDMNANLPKLNSFILPGGGEIAARLHLARTVCRRTERALVLLAETEKLDDLEIPYLNRLSDWLFVAARFVAHQLGIEEILWKPQGKD